MTAAPVKASVLWDRGFCFMAPSQARSRSSFGKQQLEKQNAEDDNRDRKGCRIMSVGTRNERTIERAHTKMDFMRSTRETLAADLAAYSVAACARKLTAAATAHRHVRTTFFPRCGQ